MDNFCCSVLRGRDNEFVSPEATHKLAKLPLPPSDYVTTPHEYILSEHPAERHFPLMELCERGGCKHKLYLQNVRISKYMSSAKFSFSCCENDAVKLM